MAESDGNDWFAETSVVMNLDDLVVVAEGKPNT